jgi:two-component sensor histidine kinase
MRISILFIFFVFCLSSFSQEKVSFQYSVINTSSGLNTNNVNDCVRDNRGFLWIATDFGLTRYSDQNSVHFVTEPTTGNPLSHRMRLLIRDSILYVCGRPGFYTVNTNDLTITPVMGFSNHEFEDMLFYRDQIILSTRGGELIFYDIRSKKSEKINTGYGFLVDILVKGDDLFCLSLDKGCLRYDIKTKKLIQTIILHPFVFSDKLYLSKNGDILFLSQAQLKKYDAESRNFSILPGAEANLTGYHEGQSKSKYIITGFNYFEYVDSSSRKYKLVPPIDKNTEFKNVKEGNEGEVFLITNQGLVVCRRIVPFKIWDVFKDGKSHVRRAIMEDVARKKILFFSYDKLAVYDRLKGSVFNKDLSLLTHSAIKIGDSLILATEGSTINSLQLSDYRSRRLFIKEYRPVQFIAFDQLENGSYLLGTLDGLFITSDFSKGIRKVSLSFAGKDYSGVTIKALWSSNPNRVWIGSNVGIFELDKNLKIVAHYSTSSTGRFKIPTNEVNCFYANSDGIYAGLDGELIFIPFSDKPIRFFYTKSFGKSSNRIVSILEDNYHDIWFSSYQGIYRLNTNSGNIRAFHAPLYFSNDEFNRSSAWKTSDGNLFFGSIAEFVSINPDNYRDQLSIPQLHFNIIKIFSSNKNEKVRYDVGNNDSLYLPVEGSSIEISYSINDLFNSENTKYQYRIQNLSQDWIDLSNRSSLQLFSLPAGKYNLQIKASGYDGYSSEILQLFIFVPAVFYKTLWFFLLVIFLIVIIGVGIYWIRVNNLKQRLRFRKELSNDLHDTVGTAVTKSIYAAQSILDETNEHDKRLQQIIDYGRQIHTNFRDVIWSLDSKTDEIVNLFDRINEIGNNAVENSQFDFLIKKEGIDERRQLTNLQKREILLISRECIHNAIKHSNGNLIVFEFSMQNEHLHLRISDDGINQDEELDFKGMGLSSIMLRVKKMHGSVTFSKNVNGFVINLYL